MKANKEKAASEMPALPTEKLASYQLDLFVGELLRKDFWTAQLIIQRELIFSDRA